MKTIPELREKIALLKLRVDKYKNIAYHAHDNAPGSFVTGGSGRSHSLDKRNAQAWDKGIKYLKLAQYWEAKIRGLERLINWIETKPTRDSRRVIEKVELKECSKRKKAALREAPLSERIFIGLQSGSIVYADKAREINGDYATLARQSYKTLELAWRNKCSAEIKEYIIKQAEIYKSMKGKQLQLAMNVSITLGE